jgi:chromate transport protein ChrA
MTYLKLYLVILKVASLSFGGAYSIWTLIEHELTYESTTTYGCEGNRAAPHENAFSAASTGANIKFCPDDFKKVLGFSELLPGPQVNTIAMLAYRAYGITGMLVIVLALITPGLILVPTAVYLHGRATNSKYWRRFLAGATIGAIALLVLFFLKLGQNLVAPLDYRAAISAGVLVVAFWASARYRVNPLAIATVGALVGYVAL